MTPLASLPMWFDADQMRSCHIHVYNGACTVDMRTSGQAPVTLSCSTLAAAFDEAEMLRRLYSLESHVDLGDISKPQLAA